MRAANGHRRSVSRPASRPRGGPCLAVCPALLVLLAPLALPSPLLATDGPAARSFHAGEPLQADRSAERRLHTGEPLQTGRLVERHLHTGRALRAELSSSEPFTPAGGILFAPREDETVTVDALSLEFDTLLTISRLLEDGSGIVLFQDDDDGAGTNSRITFPARRGTVYRIEIESGERAICGRRFAIAVTSGDPAIAVPAGEPPLADYRSRERADEGYWNDVDASLIDDGSSACRLRAMAGRARTLGFWGHYDRARALAGESVAAARRWFGEHDLLLARALHELATIEADMGEYADGRMHSERALEIREARLGPDHPLLAAPLRVLGTILQETGTPEENAEAQERAVAITEARLGPDHPETIASVSALGNALGAGYIDLARGRRLLERALKIRRERLDSDDLSLAETLRDTAMIQVMESAFEEAASLSEEADTIAERRLGPDHPYTAWYLGVLGQALEGVGRFERATPAYDRMLRIYQGIFPDDHPFMWWACGLVARHHFLRGDYAQARPLAEHSLRIAESLFGPRSPSLSSYIQLPARIDIATGSYADAESLLVRSLEITREANGGENMPHALSLRFLGELRRATGDLAAAEDAYRRSLRITTLLLGRHHHLVGDLLSELGEVRHDRGDYADATALYEEALTVQAGRLGEAHPAVARISLMLAEGLAHSGETTRSRDLASRGLELIERELGAEHPWVAEGLQLLARLDGMTGRREIAVDEALQAEAISRGQLDAMLLSLSERRALAYASLPATSLDLGLSLAVEDPADAASARRVWDAVVRSRALILDEMAARHRLANTVAEARTADLRSALSSARSRLAHIMLRDPGNMPVANYRRLIDTTRMEKEALEEQLAQLAPSSRRWDDAGRVGINQVTAALMPGSALIAYVSYDRFFGGMESPASHLPESPTPDQLKPPTPHWQERPRPLPPEPSTPRWQDEGVPSYLAFVLRAGRSAVEVVPLGSKADIDALVEAWRSEALREPSILRAVRKREEDDYRSSAARLRTAVWDPVARHLSDVSQVIVVPDGSLNLVNLSTLPNRNGRFLVEEGPTVHYISAERDLVRQAGSDSAGEGILLVGNPDFDLLPDATILPERLASLVQDADRTPLYRSPTPGCEAFRRTHFRALPEAAEEVREIGAIWRSRGEPLILTGAEAAEPAFKLLTPGRRIIHVATHGFFIDEECRARDRYLEGTPESDWSLLASGLALAGANRCNEIAADAGVDDGILTAEEIASIDLRGVEWVVLSACETGIGQTLPGEGVLGLRRAFTIAGADTVIMSLWKIKDEAAREWMNGLYRARLRGSSTPESMRSASLAMLQAARAADRSTHPFYWGPFVAAGSSR